MARLPRLGDLESLIYWEAYEEHATIVSKGRIDSKSPGKRAKFGIQRFKPFRPQHDGREVLPFAERYPFNADSHSFGYRRNLSRCIPR